MEKHIGKLDNYVEGWDLKIGKGWQRIHIWLRLQDLTLLLCAFSACSSLVFFAHSACNLVTMNSLLSGAWYHSYAFSGYKQE